MAIKSRAGTVTCTYTFSGAPTTIIRPSWSHSLDVSVSVNPGGNNAFESNHYEASESILGNIESHRLNLDGCPSALYSFTAPHIVVPSVGNDDFRRLLAATNPANPILNVPNFLWELRDVPQLIRQGYSAARAIRRAGGSIPKHLQNIADPKAAAAVHIGYQFGVAPFVSDLLKIARLQESVDKRREMFKRLAERGLRTGVKNLGEWSSTDFNPNYVVHSGGGQTLRVPLYVSKTVRRWGSVRWKPTLNAPIPKGQPELLRRVTGFTPDNIPLAVWESLPWSWLVDWFVGVDSLLKANNRVIATPSHACVMEASEVIAVHPAMPLGAAWKITQGKKRLWRHKRTPQSSILPFSASFPIFTGNQLSILASLAVLRTRVP